MNHYRGDIDGLRAVAIVPVLLFHAGIGGFGGGFVGVDVFFVISGFLITGIILPEVENGRFSVVAFYERRVRRIFPALFTVLLVSAVVATCLLLPRDLGAFGRSLLATTFFASNFDFWQQAGYFGPATEEIPLLHTWSLAVEEQFYIFFPLFLLACARGARRRLIIATLLVIGASFALSVAGVTGSPDATFYLAPSRAWELGLGALLAMGAIPPSHDARVRNAVAVLGAAAVFWSVFTYSRATPFPGAAALLPCLGAASIIWAGSGGHNVVGAALRTRALVLTGLVSYSLYLWHWPLLVFARYYLIRPLTSLEAATILGVAAFGAVASWRIVERPFRGKSGLCNRRQLFLAAGGVMAAMSVYGTILLVSAGWPARMSADVRQIMASADDRRPQKWRCGRTSDAQIAAGRLCRFGSARAAEPTFIVWGDSHARVLIDAIGAAADRHGRSGLLATRSSCPPLLGVHRTDFRKPGRCSGFNREVLALIARSPQIEDVVLDARWAQSAEGTPYGPEPNAPVFLSDSSSTELSIDESRRVFDRSLRRTVAELLTLGRRVWLVGPVPEVGWDVPSTIARSKYLRREIEIAPTRSEFEQRQASVLRTMTSLAQWPGVALVRPDTLLCATATCQIAVRGQPIYFDDDHLTRRGAAMLEPMLEEIFASRAPANQASARSAPPPSRGVASPVAGLL